MGLGLCVQAPGLTKMLETKHKIPIIVLGTQT